MHECLQVPNFLEGALIEKKLSPMEFSLHFPIGIILSLKLLTLMSHSLTYSNALEIVDNKIITSVHICGVFVVYLYLMLCPTLWFK